MVISKHQERERERERERETRTIPMVDTWNLLSGWLSNDMVTLLLMCSASTCTVIPIGLPLGRYLCGVSLLGTSWKRIWPPKPIFLTEYNV